MSWLFDFPIKENMVEGDGFEPSKAVPAAFCQSAPLATGNPLQGVSYFSQSKPKLMFSPCGPINQVVLLTLKRGKKNMVEGILIRTIEGSAGRFTVCPLANFGNPSRVCLTLH